MLEEKEEVSSPVTDRTSQNQSTNVFLLEDDINKESQQMQVIKT